MSVICKTRYVALYVLIITSVMVPAARASLPPLPEHMPLDDTIVPFGVPPLPRDAIGEVANPSQLDGAERAAANGGGSGDIGSREARSGEIDSPATPRSEAVHSGAARDVLEGPPVPLPRAQRIATDAATDTDEPGSGVPPDRPITMHFQKAELGAVLDAFARFTGLNIVSSDQRSEGTRLNSSHSLSSRMPSSA